MGRFGSSQAPADAVVKEIKDFGGKALASYDSVATEEGAGKIIQSAVDTFGRIDVLINNAGLVREPQGIYEFSLDDWDILLKTHLFGTFYCTRHAAAFMKEQKYGEDMWGFISNLRRCRRCSRRKDPGQQRNWHKLFRSR